MTTEQKVGADAPNLAAAGTVAAFATPISTYQWPDSGPLNDALAIEILKRASIGGGVTRSNAGGWHSSPDLLSWEGEAFSTLAARINQYVIDIERTTTSGAGPTQITFRTEAWANVSQRGHYNTPHNHPGAHWSGVYYVTAGEPDRDAPELSGKLELLEPRAGANAMALEGSVFEQRYLIDPIPGLMIVFPSWLSHMVHPFHGEGNRISIAFNVVIRSGGTSNPTEG